MNLLIWLPRVLPVLGRHWLALLLVLLLIGQQVQLWQGRRENTALRQTINTLKDDNARLNGSIRQLTDMVAKLKPGERATAEIPKPQYIPYAVPGPLRIEYIREPGRIETRVETITLQPKEIQKIIDTAPTSIIAEFTATRDIKAGEKFRLVAAQVAPGVYQPILELGAPVTVEVRTATPVDKIPAPTVAPSRFSGRLYTGWGSTDQWILGARVAYALTNRWDVEGQAECRQFSISPFKCGGTDYRITAGLRF